MFIKKGHACHMAVSFKGNDESVNQYFNLRMFASSVFHLLFLAEG
jgi:hypothetical protein